MDPAMSASRLRAIVPIALLAAVLTTSLAATPVVGASPPHASFSVSVDGLDAKFTDTSSNEPTSWAWDFGDGATSDVQHPSHTFGPGKYRVTLTATNADGSDDVDHSVTIEAPPPDRTYTENLYSNLVRYQDPDLTACVATATMIMLNQVAANGRKGKGFQWTTSVSVTRQRNVMRWARAHDTLERGPGGTDPNGWRNALNQYGWGDYQDPDSMTYEVFAFNSYDKAVKTAISAMARYDRPVGILGWAGGHAQVLNGYTVYGQDPATSMDFTVRYVYLTDPLKRDALRNTRITYTKFITGPLKYRLRKYRQKDSPLDDPYIDGVIAADKGWYGRYVIVAPVK
jgi:hypothetical protein